MRTKKKRLKKEGKPTSVPEDDKEMVIVYLLKIYSYVLAECFVGEYGAELSNS